MNYELIEFWAFLGIHQQKSLINYKYFCLINSNSYAPYINDKYV